MTAWSNIQWSQWEPFSFSLIWPWIKFKVVWFRNQVYVCTKMIILQYECRLPEKSIMTFCTKGGICNKDRTSQTNREISSSLIALKQGQIINRDRRTGLDLMRNTPFLLTNFHCKLTLDFWSPNYFNDVFPFIVTGLSTSLFCQGSQKCTSPQRELFLQREWLNPENIRNAIRYCVCGYFLDQMHTDSDSLSRPFQ